MAEAFYEEELGALGEKESYDLWSDLPLELLSLIQSYLTREKDYNILRFVCKSWRCLSILHRQSPFPINYLGLRSPLLMSLQGCQHNFFHPLHHTYHMHIPELLNKRILYSKYGWLLIMGELFYEGKQIFFFNPFTKGRIDLPYLPLHTSFIKFSFSGLPTSKDYVVVGIESEDWVVTIGVFKSGEEDWKVDQLDFHEINEHSRKTFHISSNPVFVDGYCYCLDKKGKVGKFDPNDVIRSWEFCGNQLSRRRHRISLIQNFMVESDGELLAVFLSNDGRVCVCKLQTSNMEWINVRDLDDKVVYVSNSASWVERGISRNKIYLPLLHDNKAIVFYDLTTGRYHSNGYDFSTNNFYGMKHLLNSTWIKPT